MCKSHEICLLSLSLAQPSLNSLNLHFSGLFQAWVNPHTSIFRQIKVIRVSAEVVLDGSLSKVCTHILSSTPSEQQPGFFVALSQAEHNLKFLFCKLENCLRTITKLFSLFLNNCFLDYDLPMIYKGTGMCYFECSLVEVKHFLMNYYRVVQEKFS